MRCCGREWKLPPSLAYASASQIWEFKGTLLANAAHIRRTLQDRGHPHSWTTQYKCFVTAVVCIQSFSISYSASAFSIAKSQIEAGLHASSLQVSLGISVFTLGVAIAPLFLAPLSEYHGRRPVYMVSWSLYTATFFMTGFAPSIAVYLIGRALMGIFGSVSSTVVGGTISDLWQDIDRGNAMAIFAYSALLGTASGPLTMGYVAQNIGWRAIEFIQLAFNGSILLVLMIGVPETLSSRLDHSIQPAPMRLSLSSIRPLLFLITEPIVALLSLWISFAWGVLYLFLEAIPAVGITFYELDTGEQGLSFAGLAVGFSLGLASHFALERISKGGTPERRFLAASLGGWLFPLGLLWFGLGTYSSHVLVPFSGTACAAAGLYVFYLAIFNYFGDIYVRHTASALASQSFLRNLFSTAFPLFATAFFTRLGPVKACAIMAAIAAVLSTFPIILQMQGAKFRSRSKYANNLSQDSDMSDGPARQAR